MDEIALKALIRDIPDFPEPGVVFKDITPLLGDAAAFSHVVDVLAGHYAGRGVTKVAGIEARGFIFAAPVAVRLGAGFVPVRKEGKLPHEVEGENYELEYGTDLLEIHKDAVHDGDRVLIVDDVLATGGTAAATVRLMRRMGAGVVGIAVLVELEFLGGRSKLEGIELLTLMGYDGG
jgi:adenine phosphoribosyltransferase